MSIHVASHSPETIFPRPESAQPLNFYSDVAGHVDLDRAKSRALVSVERSGAHLEIDLA